MPYFTYGNIKYYEHGNLFYYTNQVPKGEEKEEEEMDVWDWCNKYGCFERDLLLARRGAAGVGRMYRGVARKTIVAEGKVERVDFLHSQGTVLSGEFTCHQENEPKREMFKEQKDENEPKNTEEDILKAFFEL